MIHQFKRVDAAWAFARLDSIGIKLYAATEILAAQSIEYAVLS